MIRWSIQPSPLHFAVRVHINTQAHVLQNPSGHIWINNLFISHWQRDSLILPFTVHSEIEISFWNITLLCEPHSKSLSRKCQVLWWVGMFIKVKTCFVYDCWWKLDTRMYYYVYSKIKSSSHQMIWWFSYFHYHFSPHEVTTPPHVLELHISTLCQVVFTREYVTFLKQL